MNRKLSRETRRQIAAVERAGGSVRYKRDGHVVFLDRAGHYIGTSAATKNNDGHAGRNIMAELVAKVGPPRPAKKKRPAHQQLLDLPTPQLVDLTSVAVTVTATSPTKEGRSMEKKVTILVCDACADEGHDDVGAIDTLTITSMVTSKQARVDVCQRHQDQAFSTGVLVAKNRRSAGQVARATSGRKFDATMRCPLPGDDGYESSGQGMFQHLRHHHQDAEWNDALKDAARAAFDAAHANGKAKKLAAI